MLFDKKTEDVEVRVKKIPTSLSMDVLKRFLPESGLEELVKHYLDSRKAYGTKNRFDFLKKPITKKEIEILRWYIGDENIKLSVKEKEFGIKKGALATKAATIAVRVLFNNKEHFDELLEKVNVEES